MLDMAQRVALGLDGIRTVLLHIVEIQELLPLEMNGQ
jgi:hypothetical protein